MFARNIDDAATLEVLKETDVNKSSFFLRNNYQKV